MSEIIYCANGCTRRHGDEWQRVTTEPPSQLCDRCEKRLHDWLRTLPDKYALLPGFLEHGATEKNPESKATKSANAPAPMRLDIIDLLDTRRGRRWNGTEPAHDRRGVVGTSAYTSNASSKNAHSPKPGTTPQSPKPAHSSTATASGSSNKTGSTSSTKTSAYCNAPSLTLSANTGNGQSAAATSNPKTATPHAADRCSPTPTAASGASAATPAGTPTSYDSSASHKPASNYPKRNPHDPRPHLLARGPRPTPRNGPRVRRVRDPRRHHPQMGT
jgi:hypothetical protein